jgi:YbbR domain-containing protein
MKNVVLNNIGLKVLALFLAVVTWAYIVVELQRGTTEEREALQSILPYRMISKRLPVKLNIVGSPGNRHSIHYDGVIVSPSEIVVVGPKAVLGKLTQIETQPIDISGHTRTLSKDISIIPPVKGFIKEKFISVTVPIMEDEEG